MTNDYRDFYRGRRVLITGGLGFIGSNLARSLVDLGADVLIVDSLIDDYGGNLFNVHGIEDRVRINIADIRQGTTMAYLVRGREVIFNLAGQVSHIDSMRDPHTDLEINCRSQLTLLEACRQNNPGTKVVYAGTRQIYGRPDRLPVDESHLVRPTDINGINKAAGEQYHLVYNNVFGVRACSLRLTNVYGPRQLIRHNRQGFIGWFIRLAIEGGEIQIFGDGSQIRDFVYVDDVSDAFLRAGYRDACNGGAFNIGGSQPISHRRSRGDPASHGRHGIDAVRGLACRRAAHRHRIVLFGFVALHVHDRMAADGRARRGSRQNARLLSSALVPLRRGGLDDACAFPLADARAPTPAPFGRPSNASSRAAGSCSGRSSRRLKPSSPRCQAHATPVGVGNGTDAIALALRAAGVEPGDEVITSAVSARVHRARHPDGRRHAGVRGRRRRQRQRSTPRPSSRPITSRTAAIVPVHLYGQAADMTAPHDDREPSRHRARRGRVPGASGDGRGPAGRHDGHCRHVQLLPDEESGRARRWRRDHHQRCGGRRTAEAPQKRRTDRSIRSHGDSA